MLQYQNQKLAQQLDHQRSEISALENKCSQFRSKQASYDDTLITVNRAWNQVCPAPSSLFNIAYEWFSLTTEPLRFVYLQFVFLSYQIDKDVQRGIRQLVFL